MRVRTMICAVIGAGLLVAGCTTPEKRDAEPVDPQVLQDVIDASLLVPGTEMRRALRVQAFGRNKGIEECGGRPGPLDSTAARVDQSKFPDLALIREKGFTEDEAVFEEDERLEEISGSCEELAPNFPAWSDWQAISVEWNDVALSAEQESSVRTHFRSVASCLSRRTGLELRASEPIIGYLNAVNGQMTGDHQTISAEDAAVAYADCTEPYFDALRAVLLKRRDEMIERHREALQDYARDLVKAGYVP